MRKQVHGRPTIARIDEATGRCTPLVTRSNDLTYGWGYLAARLFGFRRDLDRPDYALSAMLIEFENVAAPGDPVTVPTLAPTDDITYYNDLVNTSNRDYLRVFIGSDPVLGIYSGYENFYTAGQDGNLITLTAQTAGVAGIFGKPFSDTVNSTICGAALVATPYPNDPTRDIIFSRLYWEGVNQQVKAPGAQYSISWPVAFELPQ